MIASVRDLMAIWPTSAAFARALGVPEERVYQWARRGSIPVKYFPHIRVAAQMVGTTVSDSELVAMCATRSESESSPDPEGEPEDEPECAHA